MTQDIKPFLDFTGQFISLDKGEQQALEKHLRVRTFAKGEHLLKQGAISRAFFFNLSGFVRLYYLVDGEERTAYFYQEGVFISAYSSFMHQTPATFSFQANEATTVLEITAESSMALLAHSSKFETLARIAMEQELAQNQELIASLLTLHPEERYARLIERSPHIFQRAPQVQIASYLGVKPETLSRIKKRHFAKT